MPGAGQPTGQAVLAGDSAVPGEPAEPAGPGQLADLPAEARAQRTLGAGRGRRRWLVPPTRRPCKLGAGGYAAPRLIMPGSVIRTCVGCGKRAAKSDLLRVVAVGGEVVADTSARRPGRGAYLHPSRDCLERARRRRAIPRALRATGPLADGGLVRYLAET